MVTLTRDTCPEEVFSSDTQLTRAESRKTCKRKQVRMGLENAPWATSQYPGLNDHMLQNPIMCATVQCGSASRFFSAGCHEFKFPALRGILSSNWLSSQLGNLTSYWLESSHPPTIIIITIMFFLAPQSGAHRIAPHRDLHLIQSNPSIYS